MAYSNILSLIWKNRSKYDLINENLIIESTFVQQTSGCENLWKVQLGMTANYIILFRYDIGSIITSKHKESSSILLSMIPIETLRITKYPRRKLEICALDGSYSFYKLIKHRGCGTAWSKWKSLHGTIPKEKLKLNVELRLIPFIDLDMKIKNQLKDEKFIYCLSMLRKCSQKIFGSHKTFHISTLEKNSSKGPASFEYRVGPAKRCSSMLKWIKGEAGLSNFKSGSASSGSKKNVTINMEAETIQNGKQLSSYVKTNEGSKDLNGRQAAEVRKKMRLVRRFGEGIPDGCVFDLTLSYQDQIDQNEHSKPKPPRRKRSAELGLFDDFSSEKIALKTLQQWSDYETDNNASEEELKREYQEDCRQILKAVRYFQNTSLPVLAKGIKKVNSVESFTSLSLTKHQNVYLTSNVSLPSLHELALFRRTSRLSYVLGFDEEDMESGNYYREDNPLKPLSFWISKNGTGQQNHGRFYSTDPIYRKMKAQRLKLNLLRWRNKGRWYDIREKCDLLVHSDDDSLNTKFLKTAALASKIIHQIDEEYPERHTLWVESPERKNARVPNKSQKPTAEKKKKRSRKSVAEKKHVKSFKNINELKPLQVAQDLKRILQRLFYEIESAEITRYILKPRTVNEVNCPYLCGYLFFFNRIKNLVVTEIMTQQNSLDKTEAFYRFIQVAMFSYKMHNYQGAYAILCGLCEPLLTECHELWSSILDDPKTELSDFDDLLRICWYEKIQWHSKLEIPFFGHFMRLIIEQLIQKSENFSQMEISGLSFLKKKLSQWFNIAQGSHEVQKDRKEETFLAPIFNFALRTFMNEKNLSGKILQMKNKNFFEELQITCYGYTQYVSEIVEESRKYYALETHSYPTDKQTGRFLLFKPYKMYMHKSINN